MKSIIGAATAAVFAAIGLSGCGTITQGTTQDIAVVTSPPGGHCELDREGEHVGSIYRTPGKVRVDKTKEDILMTCTKLGYQTASVNLESGYGIGTFGNIILGGAVGWGIDSATGADNKYPSTANVQFVPLTDNAAWSAQLASRPLCTPDEQDRAVLDEQKKTSVRFACY